ncbi:MAG: hypothetical protein KDK70_10500 [Myxococcales bacterium]|nr:hypothetical protein [Myxococcales bacterium]
MSDPQQRLEAILLDLEVGPAQLRRDPSGRSWLSAEARALLESHPECRQVLREFVDDELALAGALGGAPAPSVDPFFTARVVEALPGVRTGPTLSPRRRVMLLGCFHVVAGLLAYAVLTMVPESTARWAAQAHDVLRWGSDSGVGLLVAVAGAGVAVLIALLATRAHTPAA